ncbi:MAG: hypothetical protein M5U26_15640 [Planctomycetota bacterium]|nr:hypothetical protein [Planctomycetota bacterium]
MRIHLILLAMPWIAGGAGLGAAERVLGALIDFEGPFKAGPFTHWAWPEELKNSAKNLSMLETVPDAAVGERALKLTLADDFPWPKTRTFYISTGWAYYPPEADAVRLRVKVLKGTFRFSIGGPTAYFGNSDATTRTHEFKKLDPPAWETVDLSLNHPLQRNYRRSGFSTAATRVYYTRWAQEPTQLVVGSGSAGEALVDHLELVAKGEGRPFPRFTSDQVSPVKELADFEGPDGLARAFTALLADNQVKDFAASWTGEKHTYPPPVLGLAKDPASGKQALTIKANFLEEILWGGVKVAGVPGANALRITLKCEYPAAKNTLLGHETGQPVDIAAWTAPAQPGFPWERFGPSEELRKGGHKGFDYNLSYLMVKDLKDVAFAFHHARRFVKNGETATLIVPFADFVCIWGAGEWRERLERQAPLAASEELIALSFLAPWPRAGRGSATISIEDVALVKVPGEAEDLRSFWQPSKPEEYKLVKVEDGGYGGTGHYLAPGEGVPQP